MMKELRMPGVYVEMQEDEMMYLDGGAYGTTSFKAGFPFCTIKISAYWMRKIYRSSGQGIFGIVTAALGYAGKTIAGGAGLAISVHYYLIQAITDSGKHGLSIYVAPTGMYGAYWRQ